jgi:hypothetical protein
MKEKGAFMDLGQLGMKTGKSLLKKTTKMARFMDFRLSGE